MKNKKSVIGCGLSVLGTLAAVYGLFYVGSLSSQELFAIPLFYAGYFSVFTLPVTVTGVILSFKARKKDRSALTMTGVVSGVAGLAVIAVTVIIGITSLTLNTFNALQGAYNYNGLMYADIVTKLFDSIHTEFVW